MKTIRFGIIGCGLMGREFASAAARWCHLTDLEVRPQIVAICDTNEALFPWYTENFPSLSLVTKEYPQLLADPRVEAVYIAVPHHLHAELYCAAIEAGKHLLGEKPFGIDQPANERINRCLQRHPDVFVRCSSESPFFPAMQQIGRMIEEKVFGDILEVHSGFLHSSDLDLHKPINWKRMREYNGEYGCMGDLGMHACHMPFRAGWFPESVFAILQNIVPTRPDGKGGTAPCETWDNATLLCRARDESNGQRFPLTIRTHRIAPGHKNTWYFEVYGTKASARWSSKRINTLEILEYRGEPQAWQDIDMGQETAFPTITGKIFQTGFCDSILQMWAAFLYELHHGHPKSRFAGCVTPAEAARSHALFTAALESHRRGTAVAVPAC